MKFWRKKTWSASSRGDLFEAPIWESCGAAFFFGFELGGRICGQRNPWCVRQSMSAPLGVFEKKTPDFLVALAVPSLEHVSGPWFWGL